MLKIEVVTVKGRCPVYQVGDKMVIDDPQIILEETDALCVHVLPTILHYSVALQYGVDPGELGLTKPGKKDAYIQCLDPGEPYTEGGTVTFRISIE